MNDISKVIPEIYYDLIGRLVPGIIALVLWPNAMNLDMVGMVFSLYAGSSVLSKSVLIFGLTILAIAYAIGHLVSPISATAHSRLLPRLFPSNFRVLKDAAERGKNPYPHKISIFFNNEASAVFGNGDRQPSASEYRRVTFLWYDWVRLKNPSAGTRLAKMRAEYRMLEGLYVVFGATLLLCSVVFLLKWSGRDAHPPHVAFVIANVIALLISTWAAARMFQTFQFSVINHYYQIKTDKDPVIW
jgi:hypothetical protein